MKRVAKYFIDDIETDEDNWFETLNDPKNIKDLSVKYFVMFDTEV